MGLALPFLQEGKITGGSPCKCRPGGRPLPTVCGLFYIKGLTFPIPFMGCQWGLGPRLPFAAAGNVHRLEAILAGVLAMVKTAGTRAAFAIEAPSYGSGHTYRPDSRLPLEACVTTHTRRRKIYP